MYKTTPAYPRSFGEAAELLGSRQSRVLPGKATELESFFNTTIHQMVIAITCHSTQVVRFYEDGHILLNTGGWQTVTTLRKINEALASFRVWQHQFTWYIAPMPGVWPHYKGLDDNGQEFDCGYGSKTGRQTPGKVGGMEWRGRRVLICPDQGRGPGLVAEGTPLADRAEYAPYWTR